MASTAARREPAWRAAVEWEKRSFPVVENQGGESDEASESEPEVIFLRVLDCIVVVSRSGSDPIRFRVNHRKGRSLSVTDPRDGLFGTSGTAGIWGTRPAPRAGKARSLTLAGFQSELARLIGAEQARELVHTIRSKFFWKLLRQL